jgi:diguanylate cyclase (GGDEF)-like protein
MRPIAARHHGGLRLPNLGRDRFRRWLRRRSGKDELTGLLDRRSLIKALERAIEAEPGNQHRTGFLLADLTGFKWVNYEYGLRTGDRLLAEIAHRITETAPGRCGREGGR